MSRCPTVSVEQIVTAAIRLADRAGAALDEVVIAAALGLRNL